MKEIAPRLRFTAQLTVGEEDTALALGSGELRVLATPRLAALMESAAWQSVAPFLDEGETTVGVRLELEHTAATPVGMTVWAESELIAAEGRKLTFNVQARDESGPIGAAVHERAVVKSGRFLEKTYGKLGRENG